LSVADSLIDLIQSEAKANNIYLVTKPHLTKRKRLNTSVPRHSLTKYSIAKTSTGKLVQHVLSAFRHFFIDIDEVFVLLKFLHDIWGMILQLLQRLAPFIHSRWLVLWLSANFLCIF